tara:strand:- start:174 stop:1592 length:1419 start_codon:yes stop_codon:yes gene_type:complete
MGYFEDKTILDWSDGRAFIYRLKRTVKNNWHIRIKRTIGEGYYRKALKTTNKAFAMRMAYDIWIKMLVAEELQVPFGMNGFSTLFARFLKQGGISSKGRRTRIEDTYNNYFSEYFGNIEVMKINDGLFRKYLEWRRDYWTRREQLGGSLPTTYKKVPTYATYHTERQMIMQFLNWCVMKDYLHKAPIISRPEKIDWIKTAIDNDGIGKKQTGVAVPYRELQRIRGKLRHYAYKTVDNSPIRELARLRVYYFCMICYASLLRPTTEMTELKWKHVTIEQSKMNEDAFIGIISHNYGKYKSTKKVTDERKRTAILSYAGVKHLMEWRKQLKRLNRPVGDDNYIFPDYKDDKCESHLMGRTFQLCLKNWGWRKYDDDEGLNMKVGTNITIYSWRHSALTSMIVLGKKDIGTVATQSDTSILQLSKTYYREFMLQGDKDKWANRFAEGARIHLPKTNSGITLRSALEKTGFKIEKI